MDSIEKLNYQDVGIDLLESKRISLKDEFINRILSIKEKEEFNAKTNVQDKKRYLCTIWTCKEAIFKLNLSKLNSYQKISILHDSDGKPFCLENKKIKLSVSHEKKYTIAIALLVK